MESLNLIYFQSKIFKYAEMVEIKVNKCQLICKRSFENIIIDIM
jgi:hypothetical protein